MKLTLPNIRQTSFLLFVFCCFLLSFSAFLQFYLDLKPCPLCQIQRFLYAWIAFFYLIGSLLTLQRNGKRAYYSFILLFTFVGIAVACRQIWLQRMAASGIFISCGPDLIYVLKTLSLPHALIQIFQGLGECAEVQWKLLGLDIPEWSLLFYSFLSTMSIWQISRKDPV